RSSLKQTIANLRRTLGDVHEEPRYIQTVTRFGYRFIAAVTPRSDENLVMVAERQSLTVVDIEEKTGNLEQAVGRTTIRIVVAGFVMLTAIIATAYFARDLLPGSQLSQARSLASPSLDKLSWRKLTSTGSVGFAVVAPNGQFVAYVEGDENGSQSLRLLSVSDLSEITIVPPAAVTY